jgi:ABC-type nitrate/sulfonate/bicarbonate transport system substrate-binding protein
MIGKRIGLIDGSVSVDEYRGVIAANHVDRSKIAEMSAGFDVAPLLSHKIDGLMNYEELTPVELRLRGEDIAVMRFADFGLKAYSLNLVVNDAALTEDPLVIKDIVDATIEGYEFLRSQPDQAALIFSRLFPERDKAYVRESTSVVAKLLGSGPIGRQTRQGWIETIATMKNLGLLNHEVSVDDVTAASYLKN